MVYYVYNIRLYFNYKEKAMIRKYSIYLLLALLLTLGIIFVGCDNENPNGDNNGNGNTNGNSNGNTNGVSVYLTGTYGRYMVSSGTVNDRLIFTETNITFNRASSTIFSGTYKYDGATLTLTIGGVNHIKYATVDGENIYITGDGAYSEYIRDRWVKR
jgi:hypothetical protein